MKYVKDLGILDTGRIRGDNGRPERRRVYLVECECGIQKNMYASDFKNRPNALCRKCRSRKVATKHGKRFTRQYNTYHNMRQRCINKKNKDYKHYGGRGIGICKEWLDNFESFYNWSIKNGYSDNLTIDRKDNDGDYTPENCRFVDQQTQVINSRLLRSTNKSGYRGVHFNKSKQKWIARVTINYKRIEIGRFNTKEEAALAYNEALDKYGFIERPKNVIGEKKC